MFAVNDRSGDTHAMRQDQGRYVLHSWMVVEIAKEDDADVDERLICASGMNAWSYSMFGDVNNAHQSYAVRPGPRLSLIEHALMSTTNRQNTSAMSRARTNGDTGLPSPMRPIELNDDKQEKAARLQSRQALHTRHMDELRAAASPTKKRRSQNGNAQSVSDDLYGIGDASTPSKRVPILANFEEWMKLATDNKINAANTWNFALIDYFHDMSLLKEGDGVNFQKASCTLDGCVKIYTSRVDSVATETGKLLSGLADSGNKKRRGDAEGGETEEAEEGEDGEVSKKKKRTKRSAESTLVSSFEQLRLKKMELEFSVDPLFKKASADFDEGGAKGLLLNHLAIDSTGRIVFDSSDDIEDDGTAETRRDSMEPGEDEDKDRTMTEERNTTEDAPVDIAALASRFFPDLAALDNQDICPSLKTFELGSGDTSLDLPFLKAPENWRDDHPTETGKTDASEHNNRDPDDDDDDAAAAGWDMPDVGFGEGGEAWAKDAAIQPQLRTHETHEGHGDEEVGTFDVDATVFGVSLQQREGQNDHENILNYFDTAMHKNWAGPEHWKIARIKDTQRSSSTVDKPKASRKEKEAFEIDFAAPMSVEMATALYTNASTNSVISLPKKEWKSRSRNLLPDDKHFNSKDLLRLFLKPKARIGIQKSGRTEQQQTNAELDAAYWATADGLQHDADDDAPQGDYDANFFADDVLPMAGADLDDDDVFADAMEMFSPDADGIAIGPAGPGIDGIMEGATVADDAFGAQLITQSRRIRPEYVQYARVAKKVDVRRLKEEIWRGTGFTSANKETAQSGKSQAPTLPADDNGNVKFTDIMNNLRYAYNKQQLADISTSYGFICLLHLANEQDLIVENVEGWEDLKVRKDPSAFEQEMAA